MVVVDPAEPGHISGINIMQVDAAAAFTHLRIGCRPLARLFQIPLKGLSALVIRNIKVDDDVVLKCSPKVGQKLCGKAILNSVLDRT